MEGKPPLLKRWETFLPRLDETKSKSRIGQKEDETVVLNWTETHDQMTGKVTRLVAAPQSEQAQQDDLLGVLNDGLEF